MKTFINYRIAATLQLLVFFFIAVLVLHPVEFNPDFPKFFKMPVIMWVWGRIVWVNVWMVLHPVESDPDFHKSFKKTSHRVSGWRGM